MSDWSMQMQIRTILLQITNNINKKDIKKKWHNKFLKKVFHIYFWNIEGLWYFTFLN